MLSKIVKSFIALALVLIVGYGGMVALQEQPIYVDLAAVELAPMRVTVDEEGITQVQEVYIVSATIAGHLDRIGLVEGDVVEKGQTIASIHPLDPPFLDDRTRAEIEAVVSASHAGVLMAEVEHQRSVTAMQLAKSDYERAEKLATSNTISQSTVDRRFSELQLHIAQVESALASIELRKAELASAQARLTQPSTASIASVDGGCCANIVSPVNGVVLGVFARSEQAVATGARIAEIGDLRNMEVKVDLLSSDAVQILPGALAELSDWGGEVVLQAVVRRVEPAAFTKVSALGIEEQRVNVMLDLENPPEGLGHGYRVLARLTAWENDQTLQIPISALFRSSGKWAVFTVEEETAHLREVQIGKLNETRAQVLSGLKAGDLVVVFPSDQITDGKRTSQRHGAG